MGMYDIINYVGQNYMELIGFSIFALGCCGIGSLIYQDYKQRKELTSLIIDNIRKTKKVIRLDDL